MLFGGGSLGCGCFGSRGCFGGGRGLAGTACAAFLFGLLVLEHILVVVYQLDEAGLGVVAQAVAGLEDTGVASGTVGDLLGDFAEEFGDGFLVLEIGEYQAAVGHGVFFGAVDQGLGVHTQGFSLCQGGEDSLVFDKRNGHVGQQGVAMGFLAGKMVE